MTKIMPHKKDLLSILGTLENATILDYGCATGDFIELMLEEKPSKIAAIDTIADAITTVNSRFKPDIESGVLSTQVVKDPSLIEGKFDKIICHNVLECIDDKIGFVNKFDHLLLPNGVFLLSHHDFDSAIYNNYDQELTRKLIHNFADTKQKWQDYSDGQMGRRIPGIIDKSIFKGQATYTIIRNMERVFTTGTYGHLMADMLIKVAKKNFDDDLLKKWYKDLEHLSQMGDYYFAIDLVVAIVNSPNAEHKKAG